MRKFKEWHTNIIRNYMKQLNIDIFGLAWLSWSKGVLMTVILMLLTSCASCHRISKLFDNLIFFAHSAFDVPIWAWGWLVWLDA